MQRHLIGWRMYITLIVLASLAFYLPSKYFPRIPLANWEPHQNPRLYRFAGLVLLVAALWSLSLRYDGPTGLVVWLCLIMLILPALVMTLTLGWKWLYGWGTLVLLSLLIDFV